MDTSNIKQRLLNPFEHWDLIPESVVALFALWAMYLEPEMTPAEFIFSYYGLLQNLQERKVRYPLGEVSPDMQRFFFVMFPQLVPKLVDEPNEILTLWFRLVKEFAPSV